MITVKLFANLREGRQKQYQFKPEGIKTAGDIITRLGIKPEEVAILLINGRHSKPEDAVKDDDLVALFPASGGG